MRLKPLTAAFLLLVITACKEKQENKPQNLSEKQDNSEQPKTYAEISVKQGGSWEKDTLEYIGGKFTNVEEIDVPKEHKVNTWYIRYEGPGWENKQIAYRLYLDRRNAIDIFGKKVDTLVLPYVGDEGFSSYHEPASWGQDILKAGKSLGIGGYGRFTGDTIAHFDNVENTHVKVENSDSKSSVTIDYKGWKTGEVSTHLKSVITIFPQDRFLKVELTPDTAFKGLTTGIVKFDDIPLMTGTGEKEEWSYIATYGKQTLAGEKDQLGMAIFYKTTQAEITDGPHDHLVVFNASTKTQIYYILSAWDQEHNGITSEESFKTDLKLKLQKLDTEGILE